jgi:transposase
MRKALTGERNRWQMRARSALRAAGIRGIPRSGGRAAKMRMLAQGRCDGLDVHLDEVLALCQRQQESASLEIARVEARLREETKDIEDIERLQTIPAVGEWTAIAIYAWVGDIKRFSNARELCSYVGMVASVSQSGNSSCYGSITKLGTKSLRVHIAGISNLPSGAWMTQIALNLSLRRAVHLGRANLISCVGVRRRVDKQGRFDLSR